MSANTPLIHAETQGPLSFPQNLQQMIYNRDGRDRHMQNHNYAQDKAISILHNAHRRELVLVYSASNSTMLRQNRYPEP